MTADQMAIERGQVVYVGELTDKVSEKELRKEFKEFGDIRTVFLSPSGFANITFYNHRAAHEAADEMDGVKLHGKRMQVLVKKPPPTVPLPNKQFRDFPARFPGGFRNPTYMKKIDCFFCKEKGHYSFDCPKKKEDNERRSPPRGGRHGRGGHGNDRRYPRSRSRSRSPCTDRRYRSSYSRSRSRSRDSRASSRSPSRSPRKHKKSKKPRRHSSSDDSDRHSRSPSLEKQHRQKSPRDTNDVLAQLPPDEEENIEFVSRSPSTD